MSKNGRIGLTPAFTSFSKQWAKKKPPKSGGDSRLVITEGGGMIRHCSLSRFVRIRSHAGKTSPKWHEPARSARFNAPVRACYALAGTLKRALRTKTGRRAESCTTSMREDTQKISAVIMLHPSAVISFGGSVGENSAACWKNGRRGGTTPLVVRALARLSNMLCPWQAR